MSIKNFLKKMSLREPFHEKAESLENIVDYVKKKFESEGIMLDFDPFKDPSYIPFFEKQYARLK